MWRKSSQQGSQQSKGIRRAEWGSSGTKEQCDQSVETKGQVGEVRQERCWSLACGPEAWFWEQRECIDMICLGSGTGWKDWNWVSVASLWEMDWKVLGGCQSQVEAVTKCRWEIVVWTKGGDSGEEAWGQTQEMREKQKSQDLLRDEV